MGSTRPRPRWLEGWLPALVRDSDVLRPRGVALVRLSLESGLWLGALCGWLYFAAGRAEAALGLLSLPLLVLGALSRFRATADLPRASNHLAWILLAGSGAGAAFSGGLASPVLWGAVVAASLRAAFGHPRALLAALLVPAGVGLASLVELPGTMPAVGVLPMTLLSLMFVVSGTGTLLHAERAARSASRTAFRDPAPRSEADRWELEGARLLLESAPVALFTLDPDGLLGRLRSPAARPLVQPRAGSELGRGLGDIQSWVARCGSAEDAASVDEALHVWRAGAPAEAVLRLLPRRVGPASGDRAELEWGPVLDGEGQLERLVCAAREVSPRLPTGATGLLETLEPCLAAAEGVLRVDTSADLPVPAPIVETLRAAVSALVQNAAEAVEPVALRRERGKPDAVSVELRAERRGHALVLSIADDGPGVAWAEVERHAAALGLPVGSRKERMGALATPGVSTRGQSGIGLAQAASAAALLGGALDLTASVDGEGAIFEIVLPVPLPDRLRARSAPAPTSAFSR